MSFKYKLVGIIISLLLLVGAGLGLRNYSHANIHDIDLQALGKPSTEDLAVAIASGDIVECSIGGITLPKGNYTFSLGYVSDKEVEFHAMLEDDTGYQYQVLPATDANGNIAAISYTLNYPKNDGRISLKMAPDTNLQIIFARVESDKKIYSDGLIWAILALLSIIPLWMIIIAYSKSDNKAAYIIGLIAICITSFPTLLNGDSPMGGDLRVHLMRIDALYFGTLDHQFPTVISPEWNNGYGQLGILYPSLLLYIPASMRLLGMSLIGTLKLTKLFINVLSAFVFYKSAEAVFDKNWMRILTMILLTFEYTRMYGVFNGGKLGGALIPEIFIPLAIAGIIDIYYKEGKHWFYLPIGMAGVLCSHIISSVVLCMMLVIVSIFSWKKLREAKIWTSIGKSIALFIPMVLGVYAAFIKYYFLDWSSTNLTWREFMGTLWSLRTPFFDPRWTSPLLVLVMCIVMLIMMRVKKENSSTDKKSFPWLVSIFATAVVIFWMASVYFPWGMLRHIGIVKSLTDMLQSANRFVGMVGELLAFCVPAIAYRVFVEPSEQNYAGVRIVVILVGVLSLWSCFDATYRYLDMGYKMYDEVAAETEINFEDYLPTGTESGFYTSSAGYISDESIVSTYEYSKAGTHVLYTYTASAEGEYVEFPKFYYDGYEVVDENGARMAFEKGTNNRLRVYLPRTDTIKEVHVKYSIPIWVSALYLFSMVVWILVVARLIVNRIYISYRREKSLGECA